MTDALTFRIFGFIFCTLGVIALLTGVMFAIYVQDVGFTTPAIWMELLFGAAAVVGGIGILRHSDIARWAMIVVSAALLLVAVVSSIASFPDNAIKGVVILTGVMPIAMVISMLWQLGLPEERRW